MKLECFTVDELVGHFVDLALQQDKAERIDDIRKVNRLFGELRRIEEELNQRAGDMRTSLIPLYEHPNMHVRLKAAKATLAVAPLQARAMLELISNSGHFPQAGEAGMSLFALDEGIFKPT